MHALEFVAPVIEDHVPEGHETQVEILFAPIMEEKEPTGQGTHVEIFLAPTSLEYVPAIHANVV